MFPFYQTKHKIVWWDIGKVQGVTCRKSQACENTTQLLVGPRAQGVNSILLILAYISEGFLMLMCCQMQLSGLGESLVMIDIVSK